MPFQEDEKVSPELRIQKVIEREVHRLAVARDVKSTHFIEVRWSYASIGTTRWCADDMRVFSFRFALTWMTAS